MLSYERSYYLNIFLNFATVLYIIFVIYLAKFKEYLLLILISISIFINNEPIIILSLILIFNYLLIIYSNLIF